ncbi:MAG: NAD(+) synthase, partial [Muribaculum sp.]|nr:NAD(+) synthase [Muribaculum sp.]
MTGYGYFRVAAAVPKVNVADCDSNAQAIVDVAIQAASQGARVVVTPEMSVTAYTCADLFHNTALIAGAENAVKY